MPIAEHSTAATRAATTLLQLHERLGCVPLDRIRLRPPLGTATERDVLEIHHREKKLCELVDGVLVEKPMGYSESILAINISSILNDYVKEHNLGLVTGEQGMVRLFPGLVRIPDVAFAAWDCFPDRRYAGEPIPDLAPTLVVEIISPSNTDAEMSIKIGEYFSAGVKRVWLVYPATRTVHDFLSSDSCSILDSHGVLIGEPILPGFRLELQPLFAELDRHG